MGGHQLEYVNFIEPHTSLGDNKMKAYEKQYPQETVTLACSDHWRF